MRLLRVTGLPPEMAGDAIRALLRTDRAVLGIDTTDGTGDGAHAVCVSVERTGFERVHHKLATGFAAIRIEELTTTQADEPSTRAAQEAEPASASSVATASDAVERSTTGQRTFENET